MAKKKQQIIDIIVQEMVNGLEKPTPQIINGKKRMMLSGEFLTIEVEPVHGERAFIVNGADDEPSFWVEITEVPLEEINKEVCRQQDHVWELLCPNCKVEEGNDVYECKVCAAEKYAQTPEQKAAMRKKYPSKKKVCRD